MLVLAVDFDKVNWKEDAVAFINVCKELEVPSYIERSRSGNGCHVWIFFEKEISAKLARKFGTTLLTRTMEKRGQKGIASYDRFFPNQDTLPSGGFGNLIALPLQKHPRKHGNSIFVDENYKAYADQWQFLSQIKKTSEKEIEEIVNNNSLNKEVVSKVKEPTNIVRMPKELQVINSNGIYIPKNSLPSGLKNKIIQLATFNNPAFYKAQSKRLSTYKIPRIIDCTEEHQDYIILPRGCMDSLQILMQENRIELLVDDRSISGTSIAAEFRGQLTTQQEEAVQSLFQFRNGVLAATTGFGKTVIAASLISKRKVNTLVIVHRKQLIDQWKERLSSFLNLRVSEIGQIGAGKNTAKGMLDIATIQSLNYRGVVKDELLKYGQIIVDECHHISAFSFEHVLKQSKAKYIHGLTATPTRKDGLQPIMTMQCGMIRYKVSAKDQAKVRPFKHVLIPRKTAFKSKIDKKDVNIQSIYADMVNDKQRNEMIFNDVLNELENGSFPIILTERVEHVKELEMMFKGFVKNIITLKGGMNKTESKSKLKQLEDLPYEKERLIIATGKYIGEGFDHELLDTLFLAMPISWKGTLEQYVGRIHRLHSHKNVVKVYDYVDPREKILKKMFEKRMKGYNTLGYSIEGEKSKKRIVTEQMRLF